MPFYNAKINVGQQQYPNTAKNISTFSIIYRKFPHSTLRFHDNSAVLLSISFIADCLCVFLLLIRWFKTMQLVLFAGFLNASTFPITLLLFIGYPLTLVWSTHLHVFQTTVWPIIIRPTCMTFIQFTPITFDHLLTTPSSDVFRVSLFLNRSTLLIA